MDSHESPSLRPYRPEDLAAVLEVFYRAVHELCRGEYTATQRAAWAPAAPDQVRWASSLGGHRAIVAERDGKTAGFSDWYTQDGVGQLDRLYVHPAHIRRGVASALLGEMERQAAAADLKRLEVAVSLTARPFFLRRGYVPVREQTVVRQGVELRNTVMEKWVEPHSR